MASFIRHRSPDFWTPQRMPVGPVEIDWTHPLAAGLQALWTFTNGAVDLASGNVGTFVSSAGVAASAIGPAAYFPNAGHISVPDSPSVGLAADITIHAVINVVDYSNYRSIVGKTSGNNAQPYDFYLNQTTGIPRFYRSSNVGGNAVGSSAPSTGQQQTVSVTQTGTSCWHYLNGEPNGSGSIGTNFPDGSVPLFIGSRADGVTQMNGTIGPLFLYNVGLSAAMIAWLTAEPFAMLRPRFVPRRSVAAAAPPAGVVRVSQAVLEALSAPTGTVRVSQAVLEALSAPTGTVRVSQAVLESLTAPTGSVRVSQAVLEVLIASNYSAPAAGRSQPGVFVVT